MSRYFRIIIGLGLIGYALYVGNSWFYLGIIPLIFGIINWCPLEKVLGGCKDGVCTDGSCCSTPRRIQTEEGSSCCSIPTQEKTSDIEVSSWSVHTK